MSCPQLRSTLLVAAVVLCLTAACASSGDTREQQCDRYRELAAVMACFDPAFWSFNDYCPTDAELAARGYLDIESLDDCIEWLETACSFAETQECSCLRDGTCACSIDLVRRDKCSNQRTVDAGS